MKRKTKTTIILLIATLMATQSIVVNAAQLPIVEVSVDDIYLRGGEYNTLNLNFENTGVYKIFDVQAFLTSSVPGITILTDQHKVLKDIAAEKSKSYQPEIYVDESVSLGAYALTLTFSYKATSAAQTTAPITVMVGVVVDESYVPKISFTPMQESIKVKAGMENDIEYLFTSNWNETLSDIQFLLSSSSSNIAVTENVNSLIEDLPSGRSITIAPVVSVTEGTLLGTYTISATASYQDLGGRNYQQEFLLPVTVDSAVAARNTIITIDSMEVLQESIQPGDIFTIDLTIECSGSDSYSLLSSLSFGTMSSISPISPTTVSLGDLETDNIVSTSYQLLAAGDISAGQYPVTTTVTYTDTKGIIGSLTETFTILVDGLIEFSLLDVPTEKVPVGETSELEADLLLIGTESVQFVAIGVVEDGVIERVSGSEEYIGAVDPDSPIPFDIKYKVRDDAPEGNHELTLSVQYRDHLNKEHVEEMSLDIEIGEVIEDLPEPEQGGIWAWIRRLLGLGP